MKLKYDEALSSVASKFNLRRYIKGVSAALHSPLMSVTNAISGRCLHSFPFPLELSLLCPFPLNLSSLCPPHNPNQPVDMSRRCSS